VRKLTREKNRLAKSLLAAGLAIIVAVAAITVYLVVFRPDTEPASEPNPWTKSTDEAGGTYPFPDGREITVPPNAVDGKAALVVSPATPVAANESAPFVGVRSGAVVFDVSLVQGGEEIQPLEPLTITIPLEGDLLPEGVDPSLALLYTELAEGQYWYMPSTVESGVLTGELYHLSPKYVAYLNETEFLKKYPLSEGYVDQENCDSKVETAGVEVEFGPATTGWSNDDEDSPLGACLSVDDDGNINVGVANWLNYIVSVTASDGVELAASSGGLDEETVKYFAGLIYPGELDAFVGVEGVLEATIPVDSLPARLDIEANGVTFLAKVGLVALGAILDVFTGGMGTQVLRTVLEAVEVISCIQDAFDIALDPADLSFFKVVDLLVSECAELIAQEVGYDMGWGLFGRWLGAVRLVVDVIQLVLTGLEGLRAHALGGMTIEVVSLAPDCISEWEANELFLRALAERGDSSVDLDNLNEEIEYQLENYPLEIVCTDDWATASLTAGGDGIHLYKWNGSSWEILGWGSYWHGDHPDLCADPAMPRAVFDRLYC
jgi:hypothetical protein